MIINMIKFCMEPVGEYLYDPSSDAYMLSKILLTDICGFILENHHIANAVATVVMLASMIRLYGAYYLKERKAKEDNVRI